MVVHPDLAQVGHSIEDQIRFQHFTPGPNTYNPVLPPKKAELPNGLIKDSRPPAPPNEDVPGPGAYGDYIYPAGHIPLPDGGRVYHHSRDKVLAAKGLVGPKLAARMLREYSGAKHPEPNRYFPIVESTKPRVAKLGKFSKQAKFPRSFRTESAPQIGQYEVQSALDFLDPFLPDGGKHLLGQHKPEKGYFDNVPLVTTEIPGPGTYSPKMMPERIDFSQAVFSHTTDTMVESKKLVKAASSQETPGPGAYSLPDVPRLSGAPKFQGRALAFAVPKPFHYNAQPDLGRKYQPLRVSNSGDLIFGRNFKAGNDVLMYPDPSGRKPPTGKSASSTSAAGVVPPAGGLTAVERRRDETKHEKKGYKEDEAILLADQRQHQKDNELRYEPGKPKWREGGFEILEQGEYAPGSPGAGGGALGASSSPTGDFQIVPQVDTSMRTKGSLLVATSGRGDQHLHKRDLLAAHPADLEEHPYVLRAAANYQQLAGKCYRPTKKFLPMASRRYVKLDAGEGGETSLDFDIARRQYTGIADTLENATNNLIHALKPEAQMEDLLSASEVALREKATRNMRLDGVRPDVADRILGEMPWLFGSPSERVAAELKKLEDRILKDELEKVQREGEQREREQLALLSLWRRSSWRSFSPVVSPSAGSQQEGASGRPGSPGAGQGSRGDSKGSSGQKSPKAESPTPASARSVGSDGKCKDELDENGETVTKSAEKTQDPAPTQEDVAPPAPDAPTQQEDADPSSGAASPGAPVDTTTPQPPGGPSVTIGGSEEQEIPQSRTPQLESPTSEGGGPLAEPSPSASVAEGADSLAPLQSELAGTNTALGGSLGPDGDVEEGDVEGGEASSPTAEGAHERAVSPASADEPVLAAMQSAEGEDLDVD